MSDFGFEQRWGEIVETLRGAGLDSLAAYVQDVSTAAHAAPLSVPVVGETGAGKSALVARILGVDTASTLPQDVVESTARAVAVKYAPAGYRAVVQADADGWHDCSGDDVRWDALVRGREPLALGSRLEVGLPSDELLAWNVSIVDTPGMNTDTPELESRAWASAAAAPVVIVTIPAGSAGRATDIDYLDSLGTNSASSVIVLTKVDQVPEGAAARIVTSFQDLLAKRGISPLAMVAASATGIGDDERWGIAELRRVLADVTGTRRDHLVAHHCGGRVAERLRGELSALRLARAALESEASTVQERIRSEASDIEADAADREAEFREAVETQQDRVRRLRAEAFNRMYEVGERILHTISEEIAPLHSRREVTRFADGPVRRHVLEWRAACIAAAEDRFAALEQAGAEVAKREASRRLAQQRIETDWLQALSQATGTRDTDREPAHVESLRSARADLLNQIEDLKAPAPASDLAGIEQALAAQQQKRDELVYEPQIDVKSLDQGKQQFAEAGRTLGMVADVALTLVPIPMGGKVGTALKNLPGGKTLVDGIGRYNTLIGRRDQWLQTLIAGKTDRPIVSQPNPSAEFRPGTTGGGRPRRVIEGSRKPVSGNLGSTPGNPCRRPDRSRQRNADRKSAGAPEVSGTQKTL